MTATISRPSGEINLEVDKGSSFSSTIPWSTGTLSNNTPVDLTGCTANLLAKELTSNRTVSDTVVLELTIENGGIVLGTTDGKITLIISDEDSSEFTWNFTHYSLEIYFPNGETRRLFRGLLTAFDRNSRQ